MKNQLQSVNLIAQFDRDLYKKFVNQIVDLGYQKCISTKDNFSFY